MNTTTYLVFACCTMDDVPVGVYSHRLPATVRALEVHANPDLRFKAFPGLDWPCDTEYVCTKVVRVANNRFEVIHQLED